MLPTPTGVPATTMAHPTYREDRSKIFHIIAVATKISEHRCFFTKMYLRYAKAMNESVVVTVEEDGLG